MIVTDPPYNVNYGDKAEFLDEYLPGKGHRNQSRIANDNMSNSDFYRFMKNVYSAAYKIMREGAAIYVFHAEITGHVFRQAFLDAGLKLSQCLIWEKNTFVLGRQDYQWRHEPCLYGWKEGAAHYFINDRSQDSILPDEEVNIEKMKKEELVAYAKELRDAVFNKSTIICENKPTVNDLHPTMKPVPLIGRLITNSSLKDWNVLDLFGGSGTTMIAAEQLDRNSFLMELDPKYCDVIVQRWESFTGEKAKLIRSAK